MKTVTLYKGEKARDIALYSMRDKVVQQSMANELTKIFDPLLSKAAFAYRPNKSALDAVGVIEANVKSGRFSHFLEDRDLMRFPQKTFHFLCPCAMFSDEIQ